MASEGAASWWNSPWAWSKRRPENEQETMEEEQALHRKRLAAILRYIASIHQDVSSSGGYSCHHFVRPISDDENTPNDFFQNETNTEDDNGVLLFSTNDFRKLISVEAIDDSSSWGQSSPPFSFYASMSSMGNNRDPVVGADSKHSSGLYGLSSVATSKKSSEGRNENGRGLWLRLTRLGPSTVAQQPNYDHPVLENYLNSWLKESSQAHSVDDLLTIHTLNRAPSTPNTVSKRNHRSIKSFLRRYKIYLRMKLYQQTLEPIYNSLFEWNQQQNENNEEIIWGLGHAKMLTAGGRLINGPLLEVLVEVELASDGALLIRPREHTGVTLNREVAAALAASGADTSSQHAVLSQLHRAVGNMETSTLSPGQPQTYISFLKRIAMELSPGGTFQASSATSSSATSPRKKNKTRIIDLSKLKVSEAWCLYTRSKPSSVWARDANILADRIGHSGEFLPTATWSLTHGPSKLEQILQQNLAAREDAAKLSVKKGGISTWLHGNFLSDGATAMEAGKEKNESTNVTSPKPIFPLATSESQDRIADLLLRQNYPAVIAEGPPGTGKTHTIANIVSAYLCEGKRVLVTSKNANALSVLRNRLPQSIRELIVDVSSSESQGMRQLQQTVERLAIRVSVASTDIETEKCCLLQRSIDDLEIKLQDIDKKLSTQSERVRRLLQQSDGMIMIEKASDLITSAPWLMQTLPKMSLEDLKFLADKLKMLHLEDESVLSVTGSNSPPSKSLISLASAKSGSSLSSLSHVTKVAMASLPIFGATMDVHIKQLDEELDRLKLNGSRPESKDDWKTITKALKHSLSVYTFEETIWRLFVKEKKWPQLSFRDQNIVKETNELLELAVQVKGLHIKLDAENEMKTIDECRNLDTIRAKLSNQKHHHSEELADAAVVAELSRSFSPDAQSALIRFAQIAGAAKFSKSAKPSKMSQRQRRRRQEYLAAFDRCCRFIPCWILTTSQISDYLPAECLFDLVVIDESSQSDVTVLPGMMRGKQWLIVGDGKQVSPTEAFVSEEKIENLRATLPHSPLEDALLPGRSFFDMCAQAFPRGRVVLHEHFRCAPEIIEFSNTQFYDGRLIPLRLPTKKDRFVPSLIDVRVVGGTKIGKVNEKEADKIVTMIREMMMKMSKSNSRPRSIGVISLIGDEQSRLIRGRLLDSCGPEYLARHDVLIGDPPQFQGAERDIVFLSMVCSRGNCPTQNQQFHFQRANVALSRARDRVVLVRSVDLRDVPSLDDVKVPIIEFFMGANKSAESESLEIRENEKGANSHHKKQYFGKTILKSILVNKGYQVIDMSVVWKNAFCVEHEESDTRVAIMVDCEEPQQSDWLSSYSQQKAIERVGWKCLRVDALSVVVDYMAVVNNVIRFLATHGIDEPDKLNDNKEYTELQSEGNVDREDVAEGAEHAKQKNREVIEIEDEDEAMAVSSEEDERIPENYEVDDMRPDQTKSSVGFSRDETIEGSKFGEVVNLDFLRVRTNDPDPGDEFTDDDLVSKEKKVIDLDSTQESNQLKRPSSGIYNDQAIDVEELDQFDESVARVGNAKSDGDSSKVSSQKRRKMAKYSRDGRWYPGKEKDDCLDENNNDWYDTDCDIRNGNVEEDESWNGEGDQHEREAGQKEVGHKVNED